jgi:hypothetical protein
MAIQHVIASFPYTERENRACLTLLRYEVLSAPHLGRETTPTLTITHSVSYSDKIAFRSGSCHSGGTILRVEILGVLKAGDK